MVAVFFQLGLNRGEPAIKLTRRSVMFPHYDACYLTNFYTTEDWGVYHAEQ